MSRVDRSVLRTLLHDGSIVEDYDIVNNHSKWRSSWWCGPAMCHAYDDVPCPCGRAAPIPEPAAIDRRPDHDSLVAKFDQVRTLLEAARLHVRPSDHDARRAVADASVVLELIRAQVLK